MAKQKQRADQLVFEQGLAETRERAKRLVMAGLVRVIADGREALVDKPGRMFPAGTAFSSKRANATSAGAAASWKRRWRRFPWT